MTSRISTWNGQGRYLLPSFSLAWDAHSETRIRFGGRMTSNELRKSAATFSQPTNSAATSLFDVVVGFEVVRVGFLADAFDRGGREFLESFVDEVIEMLPDRDLVIHAG